MTTTWPSLVQIFAASAIALTVSVLASASLDRSVRSAEKTRIDAGPLS